MKSPLIIIIELLAGIVKSIVDTIGFVSFKLAELFVSLVVFSTLGIVGIVIAAVIGVCVFFFVTKFLLKTSGTLIRVGIALIVVLAVLILISMLF